MLGCISLTESLPTWGVWIEIGFTADDATVTEASLPTWGVWIEIADENGIAELRIASLPTWGVWIEILKAWQPRKNCQKVAPHMGSVD